MSNRLRAIRRIVQLFIWLFIVSQIGVLLRPDPSKYFRFYPERAGKQLPSAAIVRVQHVSNHGGASTTVACTWPGATTQGNFLVAVVSRHVGSGTGVVTAPSGGATSWAKDVTVQDLDTNLNYCDIWSLTNADSQSATGNFTISGTAAGINSSLCVAEYSGIATTTPLDKTTSLGASVPGTTGDTATSAATTQNNELCVAGFAALLFTYSAPTNSFGIVDQDGITACKGCLCDKIVSSTGTQRCQITISSSSDWAGALATYKAAAVTAKLFRPNPLDGVGTGGPFFANPVN